MWAIVTQRNTHHKSKFSLQAIGQAFNKLTAGKVTMSIMSIGIFLWLSMRHSGLDSSIFPFHPGCQKWHQKEVPSLKLTACPGEMMAMEEDEISFWDSPSFQVRTASFLRGSPKQTCGFG